MAEGAAESRLGELPPRTRERVRAHAAAADNVGVFFGEDVFIAIGSILLIQSYLAQNNINVESRDQALWAIPTALMEFVIHGSRLLLFDRRITREAAAERRVTT
jgi:uncharacterized membrane protein